MLLASSALLWLASATPAKAADDGEVHGLALSFRDKAKRGTTPARLEVALVGELSSVGITKVWCDDLLGPSLVAGTTIEPGSRTAYCIDNPFEDLWTTDVVAAPIGLNVRLAGGGQWEWMGVGTTVSTLALQKTGLGTDLSKDLPAGLAPLRAMGGVDIAFPLSGEQRVHVLAGAGPIWTANAVSVSVRWTYGVSFLVDLLDIVQPRDATVEAETPVQEVPKVEDGQAVTNEPKEQPPNEDQPEVEKPEVDAEPEGTGETTPEPAPEP